jgi:chromosome condensin MukBEF ATPase and DNA-binding subunit MukB
MGLLFAISSFNSFSKQNEEDTCQLQTKQQKAQINKRLCVLIENDLKDCVAMSNCEVDQKKEDESFIYKHCNIHKQISTLN